MSPVESYPISCYSGIDNDTCGPKDRLYVNGDADEGHSDGHWPEEHLGHCFTESTSNIRYVQVLSTVSTQFGITECFNNLQTLVHVFSESYQCSFMANTPDFCLKLVCPLLGAPLYHLLSWGFSPFLELPFISAFAKMYRKQLPPWFPGLPGCHRLSGWPARPVVLKPAQGFHWLNMGDGSDYKNTCSIPLAMPTLTQKGSIPEASPLPVSLNMGGE